MTTGYTVDYEALGDMAGRLMGLKEEFDGAEATVDGHASAIDHDGLSDELESFATNWSDKKDEVGERLEETAGFAGSAADCYSQTDQQLCDQLRGD